MRPLQDARITARAGKNLGFYKEKLFRFLVFKGFLGFNSGHKIMTNKLIFGHVNATNRSSYLNISLRFTGHFPGEPGLAGVY